MIRRLLFAAVAGMAVAAAPAYASRDLFVIDQAQNAASLDPHVQWDPDSYFVYRNVFDNIVTRDQAGAIVPQVASSWKYTSDTTLVLKIRNDIVFHDGSKLTADDVVFSIRRVIDPAFKSPQFSQYDTISSVAVSGTDEVTITTKRAYPVMLSQLTKLSVVPRAVVEKIGNDAFNQAPVGSGPYRVVSVQRGVKIELAAQPNYWRGAPPFPRVEFRPVPDESTRLANLRTGRSDITRILLTDNAMDLKNDPQIRVLWTPVERLALVALNALVGPTKDKRVRLAIAHAIDKDLIIEALLKGYAKSVDEMMPPPNFGYAEGIAPFKYDPDLARALLKEAGIAPGTKISFPTAPSFDQRVVQALHQMLTDVGLAPEISSTDIGTYLRRRQGSPEEAGDVSFFRWSCGCQDADGVLFPLFHSSSQWSKYKNPVVDTELEAARNTLDDSARLAHYRKTLEILHDDVAAVPLYQDVMMFAARKEVQWKPTPNEAFFIMDMSWK